MVFRDADIFKSADNWQQTLADMTDTLTGEKNPKSLKNLLSESDVGQGNSSYELGSHLVRPENLLDALDVLETKLDGVVGSLMHMQKKFVEVNPEVETVFEEEEYGEKKDVGGIGKFWKTAGVLAGIFGLGFLGYSFFKKSR